MLNFLHGLGALVAAFIVLVRMHWARKVPTNSSKFVVSRHPTPSFSRGDACDIVYHESTFLPYMYSYLQPFFPDTVTFGSPPKCKRDPDISIDDEVVNIRPKEMENDMNDEL